tara:strand:- start:76351 stop:76614 length:264 start_codon:yes stop_codon:yes gene_type:complete
MSDETLLEFPCEFPFKIMGKKSDDLEVAVLGIMHDHYPDMKEDCLKTRESENGNYLSITVTVTAESKEQLDKCYQALSSHELVLMTL